MRRSDWGYGEVTGPTAVEIGPSHPPPDLPLREAPEHCLPRGRDAEHRDLAVLGAELAGVVVGEAGDGPAFLGVGRVRVAAERAEKQRKLEDIAREDAARAAGAPERARKKAERERKYAERAKKIEERKRDYAETLKQRAAEEAAAEARRAAAAAKK